MVVAQLLPTPEIRGSHPDIGKTFSTNGTLEKTKIKKKRIAHLLKKSSSVNDKPTQLIIEICNILFTLIENAKGSRSLPT